MKQVFGLDWFDWLLVFVAFSLIFSFFYMASIFEIDGDDYALLSSYSKTHPFVVPAIAEAMEDGEISIREFQDIEELVDLRPKRELEALLNAEAQ